MAFALLHQQLGSPRPLQGLAATDAEIDNIRDRARDLYNIVEISDDDYNALLNEEKLILSYDGSTLNMVDNPDSIVNNLENINSSLDGLIRDCNEAKKKDFISDEHRAKLDACIAAINALDRNSLGTFSYGIHKKLQELGHTNILSVYQI
jgi:hypothetical protein|tara:strand:+ start:1120 stop:1569 length:450 start_codon:yes stop_codon:yes gene_type:complete